MWSLYTGGLKMQFQCHGKYNGPSILRPPMGPRKCGLILQVVLKKGYLTQKIALQDQIKRSYNQGWF